MSLTSMETKELWEFGPFRLDARARLLFKEGVPVSLTPKAFELLLYLARNSGRAVPRQELLDAIWPETVVTDASLTQAVFLIRKALGEPGFPRILETVPRLGYRLNLAVVLPGDSGERSAVLGPPPGSEPGEPQNEEGPSGRAEGDISPDKNNLSLFQSGRRFLIAAVIALILAVAGLSRSVLERRAMPSRAGRPPLLTLTREIAIPPDALSVLGVIGKTVVLAAPGAFYLLPSDGALSASRVPLADGEVAVWPLVADRLFTVKGRTIRFRNPAGPEKGEIGELPPGAAEALEGRVLVSRSGRFLALRDNAAFEVYELAESRFTLRLRVEAPYNGGEVVALTERFAALVPGRGAPVRAWELPGGKTVLDAPFPERQVFAAAIDDTRGALAIGGPFDSVAVFSLGVPGPAKLLPGRGWTYGLEWVADSPTLLVSGLMGLRALREGVGVVAELPETGPSGRVSLDSDFLAVLRPKAQRLAVITYAGFPPLRRIAAGGRALWAAEHDEAGKTVFAGGRDGHLWVLDTDSLEIRSEDAHTDGIPALFRQGDLLASSSDDKTVGIWKLPGPKLYLRTRAHEFLVNDLTVVPYGGGHQLVTSSSDGTVKKWGWPEIQERETIDVQRMLGHPVSFHAVWSAPEARRILAGTWNSSLLDLSQNGSSWRLQSHPVGSKAIYRFAALPRLGLVVAVGILPSEVHVFDLVSGTLVKIDDAGLDAMWAVPVPGADEVVIAGLNGLSKYAFSLARPAGERAFAYEIWSRREIGAGLQTATLLPGGRLWAGTVGGELLLFDLSGLSGPPLVKRSLQFPSRAGPE